MELLNLKNEENMSVHTMRYSDLQFETNTDISSIEESPFFSVGDFPNELHSSFDDISDYILVDESDLKRERSDITSCESNMIMATKGGGGGGGGLGGGVMPIKRNTTVKIKKEMKSASYSEESKTASDNTNHDENKKPGLCRTLGTEGRKRMLKLLRKAYKYNEECKVIMKNKNPPLSISYLPYFNLSMLWQLAEDFGVYNEALKIHKECIKKRNANVRFKQSSKNAANYNLSEMNKATKVSKAEYMSDYMCANMDTQTGEDFDTTNTTLNDEGQGKRKRKKSSI
ncbi:conserved Plasmodium protein, unknown function [Plasmodium vivax]|uniref:Uncharacterized protein n=4 Tax=Plasmodium vivax TaxID=5855 RepID=A0A0J9VUL7_PLAVI|nr:hypothetical protein PVIIG_01747 [Plasmodium vivax India VII]KMZ85416.1 hypothetical protein PVBG_02102 [Plasmodium vivax Brazil I]KMZ91293.1 hypothetical protein PVMG_00167 [Plasmodium vivax Mauritania I]CAG9473269.1 unnamed protein product [Plasmodium vivax]SCO68537.1 conserved Plasmodium protein, unknown function [Plasmodium vivax]